MFDAKSYAIMPGETRIFLLLSSQHGVRNIVLSVPGHHSMHSSAYTAAILLIGDESLDLESDKCGNCDARCLVLANDSCSIKSWIARRETKGPEHVS